MGIIWSAFRLAWAVVMFVVFSVVLYVGMNIILATAWAYGLAGNTDMMLLVFAGSLVFVYVVGKATS